MPVFWMFTIAKRTCTCYSNSLLMEEVTDISPVKANSTSKSMLMYIMRLKLICFWKVLKNKDLLQYKYTSGHFKASERLKICREPKAAEVITHSSCHTSFVFPQS